MTKQLPLVNDASAWTGAEFENDESWIYTLSADDAEELASAAQRCLKRDLEVTDIRAHDFPLESLGSSITAWAEEINNGRGFLLVRGLPQDRFNDDEVRAMF